MWFLKLWKGSVQILQILFCVSKELFLVVDLCIDLANLFLKKFSLRVEPLGFKGESHVGGRFLASCFVELVEGFVLYFQELLACQILQKELEVDLLAW